ncbi:MAG: aminopeptidase [Anaerolineae bacterium]
MTDPRLQKLAKVLVHYSLRIKPGDVLRLRGETSAAPLFKEVYREAVRAGAHVLTRFTIEELTEVFYQEANEEQLKFLPDLVKQEIEFITADLFIEAENNTKALSGVDPKKIAVNRASRSELSRRFYERFANGELRWCLTKLPTNAYAQDAGMSLSDYEDFVYNAMKLNEDDPAAAWEKQRVEQQKFVDYLDKRREIHIIAPGTDITYRTDGRTWVNCYGDANFPDGEVFTSPIEDSVNGFVTFSYPAVYSGNEVEGVRLTFKDGKVVESHAERGLEFLNGMLDMDAGSRFLGEAAFGTNYSIQHFSRDILFDEKIGGTMHMALGAGFPECGGKNESGLHWDMVCDLRQGQVFADGQLCYENGQFII